MAELESVERGSAPSHGRTPPIESSSPETNVESTSPTPGASWGTRREAATAAVILAVIATTLVFTIATRGVKFSIYDEASHFDYAVKVAHGHVPRGGELFSRKVMELWSCRGQVLYPSGVPPCRSGAPATAYPAYGINYNYIQPPLYYAITGPAAIAISKMTGINLFTAARGLGAGWLFLAMFGMYLVLRYWRVAFGYALTGGILLATFEMVVHLSSFVTTDAVATLCGVGAFFVLGRIVVHQRYGCVLPVAFATAAAATKTISAVAYLVVAAVILVIGLAEWRRDTFSSALPKLRTAALVLSSVAVVHVSWTLIQAARTPAGYVSPIHGQNTRAILGSPFGEWLPTLPTGFSLGAGMYLDPVVDGPYLAGWTTALTTLVAASSFVALAVFARRTPEWIAGCTLFLGCLSYPLLVQLESYTADNSYFPVVTQRYGITFIPMAVGCLIFIAAERGLKLTSRVVTGVGLGIITLTTFGLLS